MSDIHDSTRKPRSEKERAGTPAVPGKPQSGIQRTTQNAQTNPQSSSGINSRQYWEDRFRHNWAERSGVQQTLFFAELLLEHLPEWFTTDLRRNQMSMVDWGCAEGEAVACLGQRFPGQRVAGVDCAATAVEKARAKYSAYEFSAADWVADGAELPVYDVVVSSNVLEHFHDPHRILREVLGRAAAKYLVLLLPYAEDPGKMDPEHFFRFEPHNLPLAWGEWICAAFKVINTAVLPETYWYGEQALLIYIRRDWMAESRLELTLAGLPADRAVLGDRLEARYGEERQRLRDELDGLRENLAMARQSLAEQKMAYEEKLNTLSADYQKLQREHRDILGNYEDVIRAEAAARVELDRLGPMEAELAGVRENLAMTRQSLAEQKIAYEEKLNTLSLAYQGLQEKYQKVLGLHAEAVRAEADASRALSESTVRAGALEARLGGLETELAGVRENLAMARQSLAEQQMAYEKKLSEFSAHYQQMSKDRDEALAHNAVSRQLLLDTHARLTPLREAMARERQKLAGRERPKP